MRRAIIVGMILAAAILFAANIFFGAIRIDASEVWHILCGRGESDSAIRFIVLESRLPQAITATMAGAGLALSGLMLQTAFRNPLAGPSILGITSGASLGVALVMLLPGIGAATGMVAGMASTAGALAGSVAVMGVLLLLSARLRSNLTLLIAGMMTGYLASALVSLLSSLSTAQGVQGYVMWGMGTFGGVGTAAIGWWSSCVAGALVLSMLIAKPLNLLLLGDRYARNLGVRVRRVRNLLLTCTGLLCALITAYCGPIGFIGLAMPHAARMLLRTDDHFLLMPGTMLCGAILALGCNLASTIPESAVIPINALTPIAGVPIVIYVLMRRQ